MKRLKPKPPRKTAQKSHYRAEYKAIYETLREVRLEAGLTQTDLAEQLGRSQNFVSQAELGYKRLDGLQLWDWTHACGRDMEQFGRAVEMGVRETQKIAANASDQAERSIARRKNAASKGKTPLVRAKATPKKSPAKRTTMRSR